MEWEYQGKCSSRPPPPLCLVPCRWSWGWMVGLEAHPKLPACCISALYCDTHHGPARKSPPKAAWRRGTAFPPHSRNLECGDTAFMGGLHIGPARTSLLPCPFVPIGVHSWFISSSAPSLPHSKTPALPPIRGPTLPIPNLFRAFSAPGRRRGRDLGLPRYARSAQAMVLRAFSAGESDPSRRGRLPGPARNPLPKR